MTPSQLPVDLRAQQIIAAFYRAGYPIAEIADALGLTRAACQDLLAAMRDAGWTLRRPRGDPRAHPGRQRLPARALPAAPGAGATARRAAEPVRARAHRRARQAWPRAGPDVDRPPAAPHAHARRHAAHAHPARPGARARPSARPRAARGRSARDPPAARALHRAPARAAGDRRPRRPGHRHGRRATRRRGMKLANVRAGDVVAIGGRGEPLLAEVRAKQRGRLTVAPWPNRRTRDRRPVTIAALRRARPLPAARSRVGRRDR